MLEKGSIGINITEEDGKLDWDFLKEKINFVMVKMGEDLVTIDKKYPKNTKEARLHGIPFGVYWIDKADDAMMTSFETGPFRELIECNPAGLPDLPAFMEIDGSVTEHWRPLMYRPWEGKVVTEQYQTFKRRMLNIPCGMYSDFEYSVQYVRIDDMFDLFDGNIWLIADDTYERMPHSIRRSEHKIDIFDNGHEFYVNILNTNKYKR